MTGTRPRGKIDVPPTVILRGPQLSRHLKDQFKSHCARHGKTMTQRTVELWREAIRHDAQIGGAAS